MIVGIDIGNATIKTNKGILYDAKLTTIEPMNKCDTIKIDNKTYYLGEGEYDTTYRKIKKEGYLTFLYSALALSSSASRNKVVLGLPLSQFKEDKSELINLVLTNNHKKVVINGKERNLEIEDIEVFPEGVVTLADDYEGIVVDIGGGTTDIALVENYRGRRKIINPISFPLGTIKLYGGFIKALNSKKKEVENIKLVKTLYTFACIDFPNFIVKRVPGHAGILGNEIADAIASKNEAKLEKIFENHKDFCFSSKIFDF